MRYMLLICGAETIDDAMTPDEVGELMAGYGRFGEEAGAAGVLRDGARLRPVRTATSVQVRDGRTLTTDGPFAETKEQLGGFYIVDVPDLDAAIAWAAKIPSAQHGTVEVRPIWEMEG